MSSPSETCPKCHAPMNDGFVVDNGHGVYLAAAWHPGPVVKSFWWGVKLQRSQMRQMTAIRCERCGFLEFYAP